MTAMLKPSAAARRFKGVAYMVYPSLSDTFDEGGRGQPLAAERRWALALARLPHN